MADREAVCCDYYANKLLVSLKQICINATQGIDITSVVLQTMGITTHKQISQMSNQMFFLMIMLVDQQCYTTDMHHIFN